MNEPAKLFGKDFVDQPVTLDTGLAGESRRHDKHPEVAVSRPRRGPVAGVLFAFVEDVEACRLQRYDQFFAHLLFNAQGLISMITLPRWAW